MINWSSISEQIATHYGRGGEPDFWSAKSFQNVFYFVLFAFVGALVSYILCLALTYSASNASSNQRKAVLLGITKGLAWLTLLFVIVNILMAFSSVFSSWHGVGPIVVTTMSVLAMLSPVFILIFVVVSMDKASQDSS